MNEPITINSTIVATKEHISCDLSGEAAILNLNNGIYYGLDQVGARVWKLIQEPARVSEVRDALLSQYDVEFERCEQDLLELLAEFMSNRLIDVESITTND